MTERTSEEGGVRDDGNDPPFLRLCETIVDIAGTAVDHPHLRWSRLSIASLRNLIVASIRSVACGDGRRDDLGRRIVLRCVDSESGGGARGGSRSCMSGCHLRVDTSSE